MIIKAAETQQNEWDKKGGVIFYAMINNYLWKESEAAHSREGMHRSVSKASNPWRANSEGRMAWGEGG